MSGGGVEGGNARRKSSHPQLASWVPVAIAPRAHSNIPRNVGMFSVGGRSAQDKERTEVLGVRLRQEVGDFWRACGQMRMTFQPSLRGWRRDACCNRSDSSGSALAGEKLRRQHDWHAIARGSEKTDKVGAIQGKQNISPCQRGDQHRPIFRHGEHQGSIEADHVRDE